MKYILRFSCLGFLLLFFALPQQLYATHSMGKDLQYTCLGPDAQGRMQYRVTIRYYRNCWDNGQSATAPTTVNLQVSAVGCTGFTTNYNLPRDNSAIPANGTEVSQLCASQLPQSGCNWSGTGNPPYPGVQVYTYTGIVTMPAGCSQVTFGTTDCCRNGAVNNIANPGSADLAISATVNNSIDPLTGQPYCNNSVTFTSQPVPFFCLGSNVTFNHGAVDVDGDSLVYTLINPTRGGALPYTSIPFSAGWSVTQPIRTSPPNSFQFNTATGQMQFTPGFVEQDVLAVRVDEYRNGVLVGSTVRDIQVVILNCAISIPNQSGGINSVLNGSRVDSLSVQVCPGSPLSFDITCIDPANHNLTISSNISSTPSAIPGATVTQIGTGDTVIARVNWTPQAQDTGCRSFILTTRNDDCPINGSNTAVYTICVFTQVQLLTASPTYCGTPVQLTATGGSVYTWTPSTGPNAVSNPNVLNPVVTPISPTMYRFTSDCGTDSVFVNVAPPFNFDAGPGGSICQNGQLPLTGFLDNLYAPYQINWSPPNGLLDPVSGLPNSTVINPVASPQQTTTYILTVTGNNNCTRRDTLTVNVNGVGPVVMATATPTAVCPGNPVALNILSSPLTCGASTTGCVGNPSSFTVGSGTGQTPTGSATGYPTVYGGWDPSLRIQMLFTAAEILALTGGSGGEIDSIAFEVTQLNNTDTLKNFTIKMACTQATTLNGWQPNLIQVFNPKNVLISNTGFKYHRLDVPYNWDGTSNLVVDICFSNATNSGATNLNNKVRFTNTTPNYQAYYSKGSLSQCGITGNPVLSYNRPNIRFGMCLPSIGNLPVQWTPSTGPNAATPPNIATTTATPQSSQMYNVNVTNTNGCISSDYVYVLVDTNVRMSAFPADTFFCSPTQIQLTTSIQGSPAPGNTFSYEWRNITNNTVAGNSPNLTVNPTSSVTYVFTLNGGACVLRDTVRIVVGNSIPLTPTVDSITCNGANNGNITVTPTGGTPPLTYTWNIGGPNSPTRTNLSAATYSITLTDSQGCGGSVSITLNNPPLLTLSATSTNITCNGAANGTVNLTATGGSPTYSYTWNPAGQNSAVRSNLSSGNYSATVTDSRGCTATASATVNEPTALAVGTSGTNVSVNGGNNGTATAAASGATPAYTYNWSNGGTSNSISNLVAGTYYVTVCDANQCCRNDSVIVTQPPPFSITTTQVNNLCFGACAGSANATAVGGSSPYTYLWSNGTVGSATSSLCSATFTVTATDNSGATVSANVIITSPTQLSVRIDTTDITCFGANNATALATATGGTPSYTYNWSTGNSTNPQINLGTGVYRVTATDANACTATATWTANEPPLLVAVISTVNPASCFGYTDGSVIANTTGGTPSYSYSWQGNLSNTNTANGFASGNYVLTVTDSKGCTDTASFNVSEPAQIVVNVSTTNASCETSNDGSATANVTGGTPNYTYTWDGISGAVSISNLDNGNHNLLVIDQRQCSVSTNFNVDTIYVLHVSVIADSAICFGTATGTATVITLNGNAPYSYLWSPASSTTAVANNISAGNYSVLVSDSKNCTASASAQVFQPTQIVLNLGGKNPLCVGDNNGFVYVIAQGGSPGYAYQWNGSSSQNDTLFNLVAATYTVTTSDLKNCTASSSYSISNPASLNASFINRREISCANASDGSIEINVNGGTPPIFFSWSNAATSSVVSNLSPGNVAVTVTDNNGCDTTLSTIFNAPLPISLLILASDSVSCPGYTDGAIQISAIGGTPGNLIPYEYSIDGTNWQRLEYFTNLRAGIYQVYARDGQGCRKDSSIFVGEPAELQTSILHQDSTIELGSTITLHSSVNGYNPGAVNFYNWVPGYGLNCSDCANPLATPYNDIEYSLYVNYLDNCVASAKVRVFVADGEDFFVPNAFTPNGDGNNDVLNVYGFGIKAVNLKIFNRWGEKVFDSENQWIGWDGTYKGVPQNSGVYTYHVDAEYLNNKRREKTGSITLIR
jgi:gliding motility-associated-like protein